MADLLSGDPTGIMSLLTPVVTGGAINPGAPGTNPQDTSAAALPGFLAFASAMGQAAMPRYGPSTPIGPALANAMSAGYGASLQASQLPLLRAEAGMSLQQRELALAQQQFEFAREQDTWRAVGNLLNPATAGVSAVTPPGGGAPPAAPGVNLLQGPAATTAELAALPEIQKISDPAIRLKFIQNAADLGWTGPEAAQFARQIQVESGGKQYQQGTAIPMTSDKGALGVAQVMPATFKQMSAAYPDVGTDITDPYNNLRAGFRYFDQGVKAAKGDQAGAAAYYVGGPGGLAGYLSGNPGHDVSDYQVKTGALPMVSAAPPTSSALGPMIQVPGYGSVPQAVYTDARSKLLAALDSKNPGAGLQAFSDTIYDWQKGQFTQTGPGVQTSTSGQQSASPRPTHVETMTPDEVAKTSLDPRQTWFKTVYNDDGTIAKPPEVGAPRIANSQIQQENELRNEYLKDPTVNTYNSMQPYYTRMQGIEAATMGPNAQRPPQHVDDYALLHNFAHIQDPTIGTSESREAQLYSGGGVPAEIQQAYATVMGGGSLTNDQRRWLLDTARSEMGGQEAQAYQILQEKRRIAEANGLRPDQVAIPWNLSDSAQTTLAATPPGARTPGTPTGKPGTSPAIERPPVRVSAQPTPPPPVPPTTTPTTPPPATTTATAKPAPATPPQTPAMTIDAGTIHVMSPAGLTELANDAAAHQGKYSADTLLAIASEVGARAKAAAANAATAKK